MAAQSIGDTVTVRGEAWHITGMAGCSHLGAKFFGKTAFELRRVSDGATSRYVGKRVAAQCNLTVAEPEPVAVPDTCGHGTGQEGCALVTCQGVPVGVDVHPVVAVSAEPTGSETGHAAYGRDLTHAMRQRGLVVTLPTTFESRWDSTPVRRASGYDFTANGHAVRVLSYDNRYAMCYAAVYVDGQMISSEQPMWGGADKAGHAIAYVVARHVDKLRAESAVTVAGPDPVAVAEVPAAPETVVTPIPAVADAEPESVALPTGAEIMVRALEAWKFGDGDAVRHAVADGQRFAPDYREAGASGAVYGWAQLLAALPDSGSGAVDAQADAEPVTGEVVQLTTDGGADAFPVDAPSVADRPAVPVAVEPAPVQGQLFPCADTRKAARANFGDLGMIDGFGNISTGVPAGSEDAAPQAEPVAEPVAADPWAGLDTVDSDALCVALRVVCDSDDIDSVDADTIAELMGACERAEAREHGRVDELIARGWSLPDAVAEVKHADPAVLEREDIRARVDADRRAGESRSQAVRRQYDAAVAGWFVQAETECRGHLLSPAGRSAGIDPRSLWSGAGWRVERFASEELRDWFAANGRVTVADWREQCGTVPRPVSAPPAPVEVALTAADVVAGWAASDLPVPVSPAPVGAVVPVGAVPVWAYGAGMRVRAILKGDVRPEVARRMRADGVKVGRVSIVPDREARRVCVTLDGVADGDAPRVWAVVASVMGAHGFTVAAVAADA